MLDHIEHLGMLIDECRLPGETRADLVAPSHPNGLQLSRTRFLLLNATLGFRSVDDSLSVTWQLRADDYDGPLIREGFFSRTTNAWDPFGLGVTWKKETGAMTAFGVPKGARIRGQRVPHENVFAVKYRVKGRVYVPAGDYILWEGIHPESVEVSRQTQDVYWVQFRLNDAEDDLEILLTERPMRQRGCEGSDSSCSAGLVMQNNSFTQAWPGNADASEWVHIHHYHSREGAMQLATLICRFNPMTGLYEWTESGPPIGEALFEGSILPFGSDWVIAARQSGGRQGVAWARINHPLEAPREWIVPEDVKSTGTPATAYLCPDGAVRLFSGDATQSPHATPPYHWHDFRNPLFCWEIDPDRGFSAGTARTVFDTYAAGLPILREEGPVADYGKPLPHAGGTAQVLVHRVRSSTLRCREPGIYERIPPRPELTDEAFRAAGIYYARLHYAESLPGMWEFAE